MRYLKLVMIALVAFCFAGCFDTVEEVNIKSNGSGEYSIKMDMGKMLEMMQAYMSEEAIEANGMGQKIDSTVMLRTLLNDTTGSIPKLTASEKQLLQDASIHVKADMKNKIMNVDTYYPFKSINDFNNLTVLLQDQEKTGMLNFMGMAGKEKGNIPGGADNSNPSMLYSLYKTEMTAHSYSKIADSTKIADFTNNEYTQQMKGMMALMNDVSYTLNVKLPAPAKSVSNKQATLSVDKKTVTIKVNFYDVLEDPHTLDLNVTY